MEWFCTEGERSALKAREKRLSAAFRILAGGTFAVFVILCLLVRTENAGAIQAALTVSTTLLGWACILLYQLGVKETRTRLGHLEMLLEGEKEYREGRVSLTGDSFRIPKSIRIRKVLLDAGKGDPDRLSLDERWVSRMPPDGSAVRLALCHSYIAGVEILEEASGIPAGSTASRKPARGRKASGLIPLLGIWAVASVIFCSFVFYQITDTDPAHKITLWVDGEIRNEAQLAARLEKEIGGPVRMVQVRTFRYAMFGSEALKAADLYIVPDSDREQFADWFAPGQEAAEVFNPETGLSVAGSWILYSPEETYRLYPGAGSVHLTDGLAGKAADLILALKDEKEEIP